MSQCVSTKLKFCCVKQLHFYYSTYRFYYIYLFFLLRYTRLTWITCHLEYINNEITVKKLKTFIMKIDFYFITHIFILFFVLKFVGIT